MLFIDMLIGSKEGGLWKRSLGDPYCSSLLLKLEGEGELTLTEWTLLELFEAKYPVNDDTPVSTLSEFWEDLSARRKQDDYDIPHDF